MRIVLLGLGAINRRVAALLRSRQSAAAIVGVIVKRPESLTADVLGGTAVIASPSDLIAVAPDVILEAASREAVVEWGDSALRTAQRFVVSSASAFAEDGLLRALRETAKQFGSQLVLSPGALAGMDALSAAARLGMWEVRHRIVKSPRSWGAAAGQNVSRDVREPVLFFRGSAREAARRYPLNTNVTVVSALSGVGLDKTVVELIADASAVTNRHEIHAVGDFGSLSIMIENRPLQSNPKSSELAALALVRLAENEVLEFVL
ncbi:MAG TPA: aspartate dehydrogenase [Steroidobacteraceae bacterium]|nr:aspartate dehydrogenase [Steroidobacteraceae bacterium]